MGALHHDDRPPRIAGRRMEIPFMPHRMFYRCVVLAAFCAAPVLATAISQIGRQSTRAIVAILLVSMLIGLLIAALTRTWRRFLLLGFPLVLVSSAFAAFTVSFGV